jgi:hypothetical protein
VPRSRPCVGFMEAYKAGSAFTLLQYQTAAHLCRRRTCKLKVSGQTWHEQRQHHRVSAGTYYQVKGVTTYSGWMRQCFCRNTASSGALVLLDSCRCCCCCCCGRWRGMCLRSSSMMLPQSLEQQSLNRCRCCCCCFRWRGHVPAWQQHDAAGVLGAASTHWLLLLLLPLLLLLLLLRR